MFPPLVQFSWRRRKENSHLEALPPAGGEQIKLSGCTGTILPIDADALDTYKYFCSVRHEGGTVEAQTERVLPALPPSPSPSPSSSPSSSPSPSPPPSPSPSSSPPPPPSPPPAASVPSQYQVKLLCVLYTVLIVKSLVFCCGLCLSL
ncbi:uncharacterized protein ABDE67_013713 [Symphorus nematophorus]